MAHQSHSSRAGVPLGDLTNTYETGDIVPHGEPQQEEDPKARKSRMDRERYAKMSREKKDERNRKERERRMKKKALAIDISVSMDENQDNEWIHGAHLIQNNDLIVPRGEMQEEKDPKARKSQMDRERWEKMSREKKDEKNRKERERRVMKKALAIAGGGEILISAETNDDCIHDRGIESTIADNGTNQGNHSHAASDGEHAILLTANDTVYRWMKMKKMIGSIGDI